jgi:hypothetical protein
MISGIAKEEIQSLRRRKRKSKQSDTTNGSGEKIVAGS